MDRFDNLAKELLQPYWLGDEEGLLEDVSDALRRVAVESFEAGGTVLRGGDHKWYTFEEWQKEQAAPRP